MEQALFTTLTPGLKNGVHFTMACFRRGFEWARKQENWVVGVQAQALTSIDIAVSRVESTLLPPFGLTMEPTPTSFSFSPILRFFHFPLSLLPTTTLSEESKSTIEVGYDNEYYYS